MNTIHKASAISTPISYTPTTAQAQREQRRKELFTSKSTHMTQSYLRRLRNLGGAPDQLYPFIDALERVYVHGLDVERPQEVPTVGTYCVQVPEELIYAAGAQPVKLCSGHYTAFSIGDDVVARDACPLVKAVAGFKQMGTLPIYENCSLMVVPITCDCKKKIAGMLQELGPVHVLPVPVNKGDEDIELYVEELYRLAHTLSQTTGRPITYNALASAFNRTGNTQRELFRFLRIRRDSPNLLFGTHAMAAMNAAAYLDANAWAHAMCNLNDALKQRASKGESVTRKNLPRIMLTGSPIVFPNLKIPLLVEEMGGIVVADETCMGERGMSDPVVPVDSSFDGLMRALAIRALRPCPCPTFADNTQRIYRLRQMVRDYHVEGVIYHVLRGCSGVRHSQPVGAQHGSARTPDALRPIRTRRTVTRPFGWRQRLWPWPLNRTSDSPAQRRQARCERGRRRPNRVLCSLLAPRPV